VGSRFLDRFQLIKKQLRMGPRNAESAYPESRVGFHGLPKEREYLVAAGIECAHDDAASREPREGLPIDADLLRNRRRVRPVEKTQLGAIEPYSLGAAIDRQSSVAVRTDVGQQATRCPSAVLPGRVSLARGGWTASTTAC
jgi:hypothetical protein